VPRDRDIERAVRPDHALRSEHARDLRERDGRPVRQWPIVDDEHERALARGSGEEVRILEEERLLLGALRPGVDGFRP
jgi:hypothetical protein